MQQSEVNTVKYNPHFPNTNQTKHCTPCCCCCCWLLLLLTGASGWVSFVTFKKCEQQEGKDSDKCKEFFRAYNSLCPNAWVDKWEEQLEKGTFAGSSIIYGGKQLDAAKH